MILRKLIAFESVAKHLTETKAARELHTSQPSVSRDIKSLETEYGIKLFSKTRDGFALTPDGVKFRTYVEQISQAIRELDRSFHDRSRTKVIQQLKIGISLSLVGGPIALLLTMFKKSHPNVNVELTVKNTSTIEPAILRGSIELAICKRAPSSAQLACEPYVPFRIVLFVAKGHPLAEMSATVSNIAQYPFVIFENIEHGATSETLISALRKAGHVPNVSMRCESPKVIRDAVRKRLGVGLMYYYLIESQVRNGIFKVIDVPELSFQSKSFIVFHKKKPLSVAAQSFLQLLRESRDKLANRSKGDRKVKNPKHSSAPASPHRS